MSDVTDEVYEAAVRAYFDDQVGSRDYLQILLERDMYEHQFRAALAVAFAAGREGSRIGTPIPIILVSAFAALFLLAVGCAVGALTLGGNP